MLESLRCRLIWRGLGGRCVIGYLIQANRLLLRGPLEVEADVVFGEGLGAGLELLGETFGGGVGGVVGELVEEVGGSAFPRSGG